ncbi:hypothetical protein NC652_007527 [Populus alba x Populus x berolinensis]|nr:hypothetical protein NC652_007527 [Populus alba x Populus x berolinensis]
MFRRAVKDFCTEAFNFLFRRSHASPQPNKFRKIMFVDYYGVIMQKGLLLPGQQRSGSKKWEGSGKMGISQK